MNISARKIGSKGKAMQPPQEPTPQSQPLQSFQLPLQQQSVYPQQQVKVNIQNGKQRGFLSRALYFVFVGWWAGLIWLHIGFALCALVVTLPLGLAMLNRLPQVITLRPSSSVATNMNVSSAMVQPGTMMQNVNITIGVNKQRSFLVRAIYFVFIGSWVGYLWALTGYALCCSFILLPVGLAMLNRLPAVLTLRKN